MRRIDFPSPGRLQMSFRGKKFTSLFSVFGLMEIKAVGIKGGRGRNIAVAVTDEIRYQPSGDGSQADAVSLMSRGDEHSRHPVGVTDERLGIRGIGTNAAHSPDNAHILEAGHQMHSVFQQLLKALVGVAGLVAHKLTGKADDPQMLTDRFRLEKEPNIAITVELLTTGIDVPKICNLLFLRFLRSPVLFEQMLGRATRLCPHGGGFVAQYDDGRASLAAHETGGQPVPWRRHAVRGCRAA